MSNWSEVNVPAERDLSEILRSYEQAPDEPYTDPVDEPEVEE